MAGSQPLEGADDDIELTDKQISQLFQQDIQMQNVSFQYPTRPEIQVLKNFCLTVPAGKTTALVGPSGSGKSTIVGLFLGWYDVSAGDIRFGGRKVTEFPIETIRDNIGLVQQVGLD